MDLFNEGLTMQFANAESIRTLLIYSGGMWNINGGS